MEKLVTELPDAIKEKGKTQRRKDKVMSKPIAEGNKVIAAIVIEANLVANKTDWVLDTGASRHFCAIKSYSMTLRSLLIESVYIWVTSLLL